MYSHCNMRTKASLAYPHWLELIVYVQINKSIDTEVEIIVVMIHIQPGNLDGGRLERNWYKKSM